MPLLQDDDPWRYERLQLEYARRRREHTEAVGKRLNEALEYAKARLLEHGVDPADVDQVKQFMREQSK